MQIEGTAAVVTGGASGLGAAVVHFLAEKGAKVAVLDVALSETKRSKVADALALECDVASGEAVERALTSAAERHGPARVVVNCAGIGLTGRILGREQIHSLELFRKVVEVNLIGTFNVLRLAAARMAQLDSKEDGERGVIVNTVSAAAYEGQIGQAAYASSKGGVAALTLPAARELASFGIRVVGIAPGPFLTAMVLASPPEVQESLASMVPFPRRLGNPAEFAALVGHICENRMINGEVIRLDGAIRMPPRNRNTSSKTKSEEI